MTAAEMNKSEQEAWRLLKERGDMITALQSRVKELEAENAELKKCPNEAWECSKEQRRVEAENSRLRKALESIEWVTGYLDGTKDTCLADRRLVKEAMACVAVVKGNYEGREKYRK